MKRERTQSVYTRLLERIRAVTRWLVSGAVYTDGARFELATRFPVHTLSRRPAQFQYTRKVCSRYGFPSARLRAEYHGISIVGAARQNVHKAYTARIRESFHQDPVRGLALAALWAVLAHWFVLLIALATVVVLEARS